MAGRDPINTSTTFRATPQFLHRQSDNTLHWVIGGVTPPTLEGLETRKAPGILAARAYVVCRLHAGRDLLIIPNLPAAPSQSWFKILDLGHHALLTLSLGHLPEPTPIRPAAVMNEQTTERFAREAEKHNSRRAAVNLASPKRS